MDRRHFLGGACAIAMMAAGLSPAVAQQAVGDFYKGKAVNLLIGFGPGGGSDLWARTIARHMGKHIPGGPSVVPQNMPGAGGLKVMNFLYNAAPKDGTTFGSVNRGIPLEPLFGGVGTQFDPLKMNWIGSPDRDTTVCAARTDATVKTMKDLLGTELIVGATGSGADTAIYPDFLAELLGLKFKTIKGYKGSQDIALAMERGEVQGICLAFDSLSRQTLYKDGKVKVLFQAALRKDESLPDAPLLTELSMSDSDRAALRLFLSRVSLGRPFVAPPGLPVDRVGALTDAFDATLKDPEFVADAQKQRLTVDGISGVELAQVIADIYSTPKDAVKRTADVLNRVTKE